MSRSVGDLDGESPPRVLGARGGLQKKGFPGIPGYISRPISQMDPSAAIPPATGQLLALQHLSVTETSGVA